MELRQTLLPKHDFWISKKQACDPPTIMELCAPVLPKWSNYVGAEARVLTFFFDLSWERVLGTLGGGHGIDKDMCVILLQVCRTGWSGAPESNLL